MNNSQRSLFIFSVIALWIAIQVKKLKHGPAVDIALEDRAGFMEVESYIRLNDSTKLKKIYERGNKGILKGPETVIFDPKGNMYSLTEHANLVKLFDFKLSEEDPMVMTADVSIVAHLGVGRPLGGKFTYDGKYLYIADTLQGLMRVEFGRNKFPIVELVASRDDVNGVQFLGCHDVDIGPKTGHVYFSDASRVEPERIGTEGWDTLQASTIDFMKGEKSGRLLRYNPLTNMVDVLASNLNFPNGVAVDKDESYVIVSETFSSRVLKYHLKGDRAGQLELIIPELPSFPDGADCDFSTGFCYIPMPTGPIPAVKFLFSLPQVIEKHLRTLIMILPKSMQPQVLPYGGMVEIYPGSDAVPPSLSRIFLDPHGETISFLTGITVHENSIYLGSLENKYIGVYSLD